MEKDNIERLIDFIMELTDDEFDRYISPCDARYYFRYGGCLELVKILKNFIPETKVVYSSKEEHFAALINDLIYDAEGINMIIQDFQEVDENYIKENEEKYGKNIRFEGLPVHEALIKELSYCSGNYLKDLITQINDNCKQK